MPASATSSSSQPNGQPPAASGSVRHAKDSLVTEEFVKGFFAVFKSDVRSAFAPLSLPNDWTTAAARLSSEARAAIKATESSRASSSSAARTRPFCVVVMGERNVGKSTFGRYLCNTMLNKNETVAYLDTDLGQCESEFQLKTS
jgi:polynucleotide 5'-kinase involved in rRNA processing